MNAHLGEAFTELPKASVQVRTVEPFRARGAGTASYQTPALDGSRPGYFMVNTHDLRQMPKHQIEALVYHEAVPGHHLQLALAQELQGIPMFRRLALFTAYAESWGLYVERLAKDMGFYCDPYSNFGQLALELRRATRLVLDR